MPKKYRDLASRAAWTALQAGLGLVTVEVLDIPVGWVVPVAWALSSLKSWVATKVGNPDTVTFDDEPPSPPASSPPRSPSGPQRASSAERRRRGSGSRFGDLSGS